MKTVYTTIVTNNGGRDGGRSEAADGSFAVRISPPQKGKAEGELASNPEQLFAAGYSACFNSALSLVLAREQIKFKNKAVTATVHLHEDAQTGFSISAELSVKIDDLSPEENQRLARLADQVCPYSKAIRGNVDVVIRGE